MRNQQKIIRNSIMSYPAEPAREKKTKKLKFTEKDKIRIVREGISNELPLSTICYKEGISVDEYYRWLKNYLNKSFE